MRRFAELPAPVRYIVIALGLLVLVCVLRWVDREDESDREGLAAFAPQLELHVKLTHADAHLGAPLFTHEPPGAELARWRKLDVSALRAPDELAQLAADPEVDEAFVAPALSLPVDPENSGDFDPALLVDRTMPAGDSCPITTPSYVELQGYLGPAPYGIDAPAAWRNDIRGAGVAFADIEGAWNARHEDLPGDRIALVHGTPIQDPSWSAHGTAVLGEVVGIDNGRGVTGIAPDVDRIVTASIGRSDAADAIDAAARALHAGDVLLVELQGYGPRGRFVPVEYWDDIFDAIHAATARGVVVIEAAGNGGEDLDHKIYKGKFDRRVRDSGAIMVGAGGPPRLGFRDRERLDFSNYGARVDVQGWGRRVATLDYGDLQRCDDARLRHYTDEFSGTSSASPIVAGAAILVESYRHRALAPSEVRDLLVRTGSEQLGDPREHIGPRPDLSRALGALGLW